MNNAFLPSFACSMSVYGIFCTNFFFISGGDKIRLTVVFQTNNGVFKLYQVLLYTGIYVTCVHAVTSCCASANCY